MLMPMLVTVFVCGFVAIAILGHILLLSALLEESTRGGLRDVAFGPNARLSRAGLRRAMEAATGRPSRRAAFVAAVLFSTGPATLASGAAANAAEIKVLSAVVMQSALDDLARAFERGAGHKVATAYAPAGAIRDRIQGGEAFDLAVLPRPAINQLVSQNRVLRDSAAVLARSAVSVCARAGAPKPDISTVEAVKRSLLAAKSIAYSDPAKGGASGIHFAQVLDRLGIAEEIKPRTRLSGPDSAEYVARGDAELCVTQLMEILRTPGVESVGQLPAELQNTTDFVFSAAIAAAAREQAAAAAFLKYLQTPDAGRVLKQMGMEPGAT